MINKKQSIVSVQSNTLVNTRKSSRLAAMGNHKVNTGEQKKPLMLKGLKPETANAFQLAKEMVDKKMDFILDNYPVSKKNRFFKLKYGVTVDETTKMTMKQLFVTLQIESKKISKFKLIECMDLTGNPVN